MERKGKGEEERDYDGDQPDLLNLHYKLRDQMTGGEPK